MEVQQREFRGLLMGPGTDYGIDNENGLETVSVRSGTRPAPRAAGGIPGLHVANAKNVVLSLIMSGTPAGVETLHAALRAVMVPSESEQFKYKFVRQDDGGSYFVWVRVVDRPGARTLESDAGGTRLIRQTVGFEVTDPRIYSDEQHTMVVPLFDVGFPGVDLPWNLPINFGVAQQDNAVVVNAGDQNAYPLCRFQYNTGGTGDFDGIVLTNQTNGSVLTITAAVTAGQILVADMDAYVRAVPDNLIVYIDTSSRFGDWEHPRDPFYLSPGSNILTFEVTGAAPTSDAACSVTWRDTSL